MSMFTCEICDNLVDSDWVECWEWEEGLACGDCFVENTPENYEEWTTKFDAKPIPIRAFDWEITHNDYDPPDERHFTGPTLLSVWQQATEYEELNHE